MRLWVSWFECIFTLRKGFSRNRTFLWFIFMVISTTIRIDYNGITSFIRIHWIKEKYYYASLHFFHSSAVKLHTLTVCWIQLCFQKFPGILRIQNRVVLVGDGFKISKEGKKMPGVKALHQSSENNSKASFIMGHSWQLLSVLISMGNCFFAVPLAARIHEGVKFSNRDKRTLIDKFLMLIRSLIINENFYLVVDSYYACKTMANGLIAEGQHLIIRDEKKRGCPKKYSEKIKLKTLFSDSGKFISAKSPIYGEEKIILQHHAIDLIWKPVSAIVRIIAVIHPSRGKWLLLSTDCSLSPLDVIKAYGLRFKIEVSIKQLIHTLGAASYRFWMKTMTPIKRKQGTQHLHLKSDEYKDKVKKKICAYEIFMQTTIIVLGLLQYLSFTFKNVVWNEFNGWLRTMDKKYYPSEWVVAQTLRNSYFYFLHNLPFNHFWRKFIYKKLDFKRLPKNILAA